MVEIKFEIGGRPVDPNNMADALMAGVLKALESKFRAEIGSIRHPDTGEFPVLVMRGDNLENLSIEVTGSQELIALVEERLGSNKKEAVQMEEQIEHRTASPVAFLCHASEDKILVEQLACDLLKRGIDVFFDKWEIRSGESIRRKIDEGLGNCTHFIAVLTPQSIEKEWVNTEIDAAFVRKVEGQCKFIPLRVKLPVERLTPLLRSMHSPSLDDYKRDIDQLISDILGISLKPQLAPMPEIFAARTPGIGISPAAEAIVKIMVEYSVHGYIGDPALEPDGVRKETGLTDDDIVDAVEELEGQGYVKRVQSLGMDAVGFAVLIAQSELFVKFDQYFKPWNPKADALRIAADLVNGDKEALSVRELAESYEWLPRRMNPAIAFLTNRKLVIAPETLGSSPWVRWDVGRIPATRRFLRDNS